MADDTATTDAATTDTDASATTDSATETLGDAGKRALDAERREKRAAEKRASDLEAKLKEIEDRDKTEAQRLAEAADAAHKRATDAESRALRLEVASEKGLTPAQAKRLVGSTREELEADADDLLENFKPSSGDNDASVKPTLDLDLGARGTATTAAGDPAADFAKFLNRQLS